MLLSNVNQYTHTQRMKPQQHLRVAVSITTLTCIERNKEDLFKLITQCQVSSTCKHLATEYGTKPYSTLQYLTLTRKVFGSTIDCTDYKREKKRKKTQPGSARSVGQHKQQ